MGNHSAGKAMGIAAAAVFKAQPQADTVFEQSFALAILDTICEPWRGCDAEFEAEDPKRPGQMHPQYISHTDFQAPLGKLIAAAFSPGRKWALVNPPSQTEEDPSREEWYKGPYKQFHDRYDLC